MHSTRPPRFLPRRHLLTLGAWLALMRTGPAAAADATPLRRDTDPRDVLRLGGVAVLLRHAQAPGTYDPPGMQLGVCATQRNLDDTGRAQSRALGAWFAAARLTPAAVRSSPWCRCLDTARLAFDRVETWAELGSPVGQDTSARATQLAALRSSLWALRERPGFEVWVTHQFVISDLAGPSTRPAEGVVLRAVSKDELRVEALIPPPG